MAVFVFGYGSLMWNPGFDYVDVRPALLDGWRRSWCVKSTFYRGCSVNPGYVLGLKRGGICLGTLFRLRDGREEDLLGTIHAREMREGGYDRQTLPVRCGDDLVDAVVYTAEGSVEPDAPMLEAAYRSAVGHAGPNREYVDRTADFLGALSVSVSSALTDADIPRFLGLRALSPL